MNSFASNESSANTKICLSPIIKRGFANKLNGTEKLQKHWGPARKRQKLSLKNIEHFNFATDTYQSDKFEDFLSKRVHSGPR